MFEKLGPNGLIKSICVNLVYFAKLLPESPLNNSLSKHIQSDHDSAT